ncbi:DeoR family transcriptional regulator [Paenibacillus sp. Z6-24]
MIDSIRRDLNAMEEERLLKRTHGGAIPLSNTQTISLSPLFQREYDGGHRPDCTDQKSGSAQSLSFTVKNPCALYEAQGFFAVRHRYTK